MSILVTNWIINFVPHWLIRHKDCNLSSRSRILYELWLMIYKYIGHINVVHKYVIHTLAHTKKSSFRALISWYHIPGTCTPTTYISLGVCVHCRDRWPHCHYWQACITSRSFFSKVREVIHTCLPTHAPPNCSRAELDRQLPARS